MRAKTFHQEGCPMTRPVFAFSGGIAVMLLSTAAWADVTPEQVWAKWKSVSASYGQSVTAASETRQGDTLVISGLSIASTFEGGSVNGTIGTVNFRDLGDGRVEVTMSPEYPLSVEVATPEGVKTNVDVTVRQPDLLMIASGTDTETRYDLTAPKVNVTVNEVTTDDTAVDLKLDLAVTAVTANYVLTAGAPTKLASSVTAESASIEMSFNDPEMQGKFNLKGNVNTLASTSTGSLLDMVAMADMAALLKAGFAAEGGFTYGAGSVDFDFADKEQTATGTATVAGGNFNVAMDASRINYSGGDKGVSITVSGSGMPLPQLTISYAESGFNLLMPASKAEAPGDFAFLTRLVDLKMNDEAWALFDPGNVLPRDPATLIIDTSGKMRWLVDIMDPAQTEALGENDVPAELSALDVNELKLSLAGAELTGKGGFTFDNTDRTTFAGVPAPTGALDLQIVGANGLVDKLIQLGFLPEDQAMGARMMMGLFAKPVEGQTDTLTSTLEFKDKGFYANGQRLQ
jgi:hypothetical protein